MVLITVDRAFCTASVGNKYEVIFSKDDAFFYAVDFAFDCRSNLLAILEIKDNVVTSVLNWKSTPASSRYFCIGRIRESYWLIL